MEDPLYHKYRRYGNCLFKVVRLVSRTLRIRVEGLENIPRDENAIFVFWHQKLFFPTAGFQHIQKRVALVSPSRDGEIMAAVLKNYGYEVIRGSSNDRNIKSLIIMIRKLKQGFNLGLAADGPQGPPYRIKPGIVYMAQKTGKKIIPIGGSFQHKYVFEKAWDRFHFPYPFTRGVAVVGQPIRVGRDEMLETVSERINRAVNQANDRAAFLLDS